jgi:hypothetical protein
MPQPSAAGSLKSYSVVRLGFQTSIII